MSVFLLVGLMALLAFGEALKVGSFNIQVFGLTKMSKPHVVAALVNTIPRWDIVCIQEIRDSSGTAIIDLLDHVNAATNNAYSLTISSRLGTTSSKEQYGWLYRHALATVTDTYQYEGGTPNYEKFERPPYGVRFSTTTGNIRDFGYLCNHIKPTTAVVENDNLVEAYDSAAAHWGMSNIMIVGDLNAGCSYVRPGDWEYIRLRTQTRFDWKIGDDADTTVSTSVCPYDRIILAGSELIDAAPAGLSGQVFNFRTAEGMNQSEALQVSDHYPVEIDI